ncbi:MAG: tRNA uridine-5-carboxymethylaminomethyl(34) synthesis GTPase MnmE [Cyclobacteriaceae bacterium]
MNTEDTIVALATPPGVGAIGVIRLSGKEAIPITKKVFKGKDLSQVASHTLHYGTIKDDGQVIDEVVVSVFKGPNSYTKQDVIEISCHGSPYILQKVIKLLLKHGARLAKAGEYTLRAFVNGRFDLAQAEAVADLITSENESMHKAAMNQMRGGFSAEIKALREELVHFASMIELELDFSEEDVEFASRDELKKLIHNLQKLITALTESFNLGNAIKNGIPTVIAGKPNAGKSTLLNALLNEEKAIVSDIPGTTRDIIEDVIHIDGISFRFIDTAGIRTTEDHVEAIGVERAHARMKEAAVIIYLIDLAHDTPHEVTQQLDYLKELGVPHLIVGNKADKANEEVITALKDTDFLRISAHRKENLDTLKEALKEKVMLKDFKAGNTLVTTLRHYESLVETNQSLDKVIEGIDAGVTNDFLAMDIRNALIHLGEITGEITTDDLLDNIFSKFCIGK